MSYQGYQNAMVIGVSIDEYYNGSDEPTYNDLVDYLFTEWLTNQFSLVLEAKGLTLQKSKFYRNIPLATFEEELINFDTIEDTFIILIYSGVGAVSDLPSEDHKGSKKYIELNEGLFFQDRILWDNEFNNIIAKLNITNKVYFLIDSCFAGGIEIREKLIPLHWEIVSCQAIGWFANGENGDDGNSSLVKFFYEIFPLLSGEHGKSIRNYTNFNILIIAFNTIFKSDIKMQKYNSRSNPDIF